MVVEKLLQLFVTKVDAYLLKSIEVENLKSSNIKDTDEANSAK